MIRSHRKAMPGMANVPVEVIMPDGSTLAAGATVSLEMEGITPKEGTATDGTFIFTMIPPGAYTLTATIPIVDGSEINYLRRLGGNMPTPAVTPTTPITLNLKGRGTVTGEFREAPVEGQPGEMLAHAEKEAILATLLLMGIYEDTGGLSYREIADQTGVSTATITRINQWLQHGTGGYRQALDRLAAGRADG